MVDAQVRGKTRATVRRRERSVSRWAVGTAIALTVLIALVAFILSFAALHDLAVRSGIAPALAWGWPVIVDGMIVGATVALVAMSAHEPRARRYPWTVLVIGAVVSVSGNVAHAVYGDPQARAVPVLVAAGVAAFAPLALLLFTHLTVTITRKAAPRSAASEQTTAHEVPARSATWAPAPVASSGPAEATRPALHVAPPQPQTDREAEEWFTERERAGLRTTGADYAERWGVSAATGRRRLGELRERVQAS